MKVVPLKLAMVSLVAVALSVAAQANAEPFTLDADRASFLAAVGESITDDHTAYGVVPGLAPLQFTDAEMSAVLGETAYESTSFPDELNLVGDVYL